MLNLPWKKERTGIMKTKQIAGIIITGVVIIVTGITGAFTNIVKNKMTAVQEQTGRSLVKEIISTTADQKIDLPSEDFIGVLNIEGTIEASSSAGWSSSVYNHDMYMSFIDQMIKAENNKGIFLYVDSPGGSVYESDEMYLKLLEYKEKTSRPVWAYFSANACSGAYYISMAADKIYANRNCQTGSIGVILSLLNCKDLYDKIGIKEIDITSGKNKAMGSSGSDLTDEQKDILQALVDESYEQFVGVVCDGRGMDNESVREIADGRIYTAKQALKTGLIDEIGLLEDAKTDFTTAAGLPEDINFFAPEDTLSGIMGSLFSAAKKILPESESSLASDIIEDKGKGVLMYYAG